MSWRRLGELLALGVAATACAPTFAGRLRTRGRSHGRALPARPAGRARGVPTHPRRASRAGSRFALALCALVALSACTPTFEGRLRTRDPHEEKKLETYRSGTIVLAIGDHDVREIDGRSIPMSNSAWFEVVGEQEIRFYVALSHKWEEMARLDGYKVRLTTDRGHELAPTAVWTRRQAIQRFDEEVATLKPGATTISNPTVAVETLTRDLHGASTVIVFKQPGLVVKDVRSYHLFLDGKKRRLRFVWDLVPKAELAGEE